MTPRRFNLDAFLAGLLFLVIGTLYLLDAYDVFTMDGFYVLPLVLVTVGVGIILEGMLPGGDDEKSES